MSLPITLVARFSPLRPVGIRALFLAADDHAEAVDIVRLPLWIDDSDPGNTLLSPFTGEAKRIGRSMCLSANEGAF